ncbi:MAG TPA: TlpA disulfide reductase family protein [Acidimicrobiales bacterium]|nr:TlpA disulfide reductase family protein [Acidimicrobiales bacterium]
MSRITVISYTAESVEGFVDQARSSLLVAPDQLPAALGWELKPAGLCRDDICVPVADPSALMVDGKVDLTALAGALRRQIVVDTGIGVAAVSLPSEQRDLALEGLRAPEFDLPDLDEHLRSSREWDGRKKLLVTFASWCGCRYDLPGWQALNDELAAFEFSVIAVAMDQAAEDVVPYCDGITMPVLYDPQHILSELYAISNVPTVVWIDQEETIVRPNGYAFGTDLFREITGVEASPHLDQVRRWARDGVVPISQADARSAVEDLSDGEVRARLHFRVAAEAHRQGNHDATRSHLADAAQLAPDDLTIWRAAMPLIGEDPFGPGFMARYEEWQQQGGAYHGLPAVTSAEPTA